MKRANIFISGRVHGVGFRYSTKRAAQKHSIKGWVKNLSDGRVEIIAEGSEQDMKEFLAWCNKGPMWSKVTDVEVEEEKASGEFSGFEIEF